MSDRDLLRRYVEASRGDHERPNCDWRADAAFAQIVNRHMGLVYGACRRDLGDPQLAEDVTQVVFLLLARKAPALLEYSSITGWLFKTARFASRNALRKEVARRRVEQHATMVDVTADTASEWQLLEPYVNDALASLSTVDRDAVVLRYIEGRSYREIGDTLGTSEDGARVRTNRALEKVRRYLSRRNVGIAAAILAALLAGHAAEAASEPCVSTIVDAVRALACGQASEAIPSHTLARMKLAAQTIGKTYRRRQIVASLAAASLTGIVLMAPVARYDGPAPSLTLFSQRQADVADASTFGSNGVDLGGGGGGGYGGTEGQLSGSGGNVPGAGPKWTVSRPRSSAGGPPPPRRISAAFGPVSPPSTIVGTRVYSIADVLGSEGALNPLASQRQRDVSINRAMHRTIAKYEPRGFEVTISAELKHPLTPPSTP